MRRITDRDARNRFRRRSSAIVLVVVLVLAGAGVWYRHWKAEKGPSEPMCLALTSQDVQPPPRQTQKGIRRCVTVPDEHTT